MPTVRSASRSLLVTLVLASACSGRAHAAWPHDAISGNLAICTAANAQNNPSIVSDGAGGAIMVWEDLRSGTNVDIYAQRVNATGATQWTANGVLVSNAAFDQVSPAIVSDGAGGAFITWADIRSGISYDVYAQHVLSNGSPLWTANGVVVSAAINDQSAPTIVSDGAGGVIIAWYDLRSGPADIYAQRLDPMGNQVWTGNGIALCTAAGSQFGPVIASDGAGGAIVTWPDARSGSFDIYAQRVNSSGTPQWTANGVAVSTAANNQTAPMIIPDGAGGAIMTWQDASSGTYDVYAQRLNSGGAPLWTIGGTAVCTAASDQFSPTIATDGANGAIIAWEDYRVGGTADIYAQRISGTGVPVWNANGTPLCTAALNQNQPTITSDGSGGAVVTWYDARNNGVSATDIYAQHVNSTGFLFWPYNGAVLCSAGGTQDAAKIAWDGGQGAIVAWRDTRSGTTDIYAQRIERFGQLGNPEPSIVKIKDVPNDQGGKLNIEWTASYLDVPPGGNTIDSYWIWKQVPTAAAFGALQRGASLIEGDGATPRIGALRRTIENAQIYYWEFVGSQVSHGFPGYSYTTSTLADSIGAGNPYTRFMVEAEQTSEGYYWGSAPDSGYSVDNLPPFTPAPFSGTYSAGTAQLHWHANSETDLANYWLYRGTSSTFTPSITNRIAAPTDTVYGDAAGQTYYYKLSAVDVHGNESGFTLLLPAGALDVPGIRGPSVLWLGPAQPNPALGGAEFRFSLPREGRVVLALFDQQGRRVLELMSGVMPAGEHLAKWDGRDRGGRMVPSGLYYCRLEAGGSTINRRFAAIR
jgi:hypothetical protein